MQKHKAQIKEYFKQWYEEKGRENRRKKNYPKRNRRMHELYMDKTKHLSINAIAKMFQISSLTVEKIIKQEENKRKRIISQTK